MKIICQIPKILITINRELGALRQILHENQVDLIISDNRYGFYSPDTYSILLTHQVSIKTGLGKLTDKLVSMVLRKWLGHFDEVWIPDNQSFPTLAGSLGRNAALSPASTHFIGGLSRFSPCDSPAGDSVLVILSGPEPQRSILEKRVLASIGGIDKPVTLIRGTTVAPSWPIASNITSYDMADTRLLNRLICEASIIVSRSGYTSVMDLLKLGKRWIVVATPGQGEQEYLAKYLDGNRWAMSVTQEQFHLREAVTAAQSFEFNPPTWNTEQYKEAIERILSR